MARHFSRRNNIIAQEIIDHQDNSFGIQIEAIVTKMKEQLDKSEDVQVFYDQITKSVLQRLGFKIKLITDGDLPYVLFETGYGAKSSILKHASFRTYYEIKDYDEIVKVTQGKKGYIDLHKAKVGGLFSEHEHVLYMNFELLFKTGLTSPEITAQLLHELGHIFSFYEFSDRLESTNQVLANIGKQLLSHPKEKSLEFIFKELNSLDNSIDESAVEDMIKGNKIIFGYKLLNLVIGRISTQLNNSFYDTTSTEQLADQFAARFGYGRQYILGLDKLTDLYPQVYENEKSKNAARNSTIIACIKTIVITATLIIGMFTSLFPLAVCIGLLLSASLRYHGEDYKETTYDDLRSRYKRIRNEYIDLIKDTNMSKDKLKVILDDIYAIDSMIDGVSEYRDIFNKLSTAIFSKANAAKKSMDEQKLLEQLAFNDLFLKAAELKTL